MERISIIIPFFNSEKYLEQCLVSVTNQDYQNLEIILINDGSTDSSLSICQKFSSSDSRIKIINQPHRGIASERNTGITCSTGELIFFMDADDWFSDNSAISYLYKVMIENKSDVVVANFNKYLENTDSFLIHIMTEKYTVLNFSPKKWFENQYISQDCISQCFQTSWGSLYKKTLFNNVKYPVGKICEDELTTWKLYLQANKISYTNKPIYVYRENRPESITATASKENLFSLHSSEERFPIEHILSFNKALLSEKNAYVWRLNVHANNALNNANYTDYKNAKLNLSIIEKYNQ